MLDNIVLDLVTVGRGLVTFHVVLYHCILLYCLYVYICVEKKRSWEKVAKRRKIYPREGYKHLAPASDMKIPNYRNLQLLSSSTRPVLRLPSNAAKLERLLSIAFN